MSADGLHPNAPSQPTLNQAYTTPGNPASREPAEQLQSDINASRDTGVVDKRIPSQTATIDQATPTSVARGVRGAPPGEEAHGATSQEGYGREQELEAQQMAAPGEDKIREAVMEKPGASGEQLGMESDLDRKKREQAPARERVEQEKEREVDVGGVLGQRGGPANPVDKDGYPNA